VLLVVTGVVLLGVAAGFTAATFKVRRFRRALARAGYAGAAANPAFRRRLVLCAGVAVVGLALTVAGVDLAQS
jgi:hypothetical protein